MLLKIKKIGIKWWLVFALLFLVVTSVYAAIDHGLLGVADDAVVKILQITPGDPDNPNNLNIRDWIPCWGVNPWSKDSQWIVYQSQPDQTSLGGNTTTMNEICIIKADGTGYKRLTNNSDCDTHGNFTPDGNKIVFQKGKDNVAEVWIMDKDGLNPISLTQAHGGPVLEGGCEQKPLISPDGTKIAFRACTGDSSDDEGQIWVMNIDGTNPVKVTGELTENTKHSWSPDSEWILFSSRVQYDINDVSRIYKVRRDGSSLTMLSADVDTDDCENWAAWSPDGKWISYHRRTDNPEADDFSEIWLMKPDGTDKQLLVGELPVGTDSEGEDICGPHSWHPSSRGIAFKQYLDADSPIFVIEISTREIIKLTEGYRDGRMWFSPAGDKLLFKEYSYYDAAKNRDEGLYNYDLLVMNLNEDFKFAGKRDRFEDSNDYCFIATAAFGSPLARQVNILRQFRDKYLLTNALGQKFVAWYYRNGPVAASFIKDKPLAKMAVQAALYPLIGFSFLLISGYMPFVVIGLLLAALLFFRFRPKKFGTT